MNKFAKRSVAFATLLVLIITLFSVNVFASDNTQSVRKDLLKTEDGYYKSINEQYAFFGTDAKIYLSIEAGEEADSLGVTVEILVGADSYYFSPNQSTEALIEYAFSNAGIDAFDLPWGVRPSMGCYSVEAYVLVTEEIPTPTPTENSITQIFNIVFHDMPVGFKNSLHGFIYNGEPNVSPVAVHGFEWCAFALALSVFVALMISIIDTLRRK